MSERFCTNCGKALTAKADFCHMCGANIQEVNGVPTAIPVKSDPHPGSVVQTTPKSNYRPIRQRPKRIGFAVGIVALIVVPLIVFGVPGTINFTEIGTLDFEIDSLTITNMDLEIDNDVGSLEITYDDTLTKLMVATLDVKGRPGADISDARNFVLTNDSMDHITVGFDSGLRSFWFWDKTVFDYEIDIRLHPSINANYTIDTDTGSITVSTDGINSLNFSNIFMETNTGRLSMNLAGSINTTFQDLELHTDTGRINLDLGTRTSLNTDEVIVESDTGSISLTYLDIIVPGDISWDIQTDTGSITLSITQNLVLPYVFDADFIVDSDTGSITAVFVFNSTIGFSIYGDTDIGSVNLPGPGSYYENPAYLTADNLYSFTLTTNTGSVTASTS